MKKLLAVLLAVTIILGCVPAFAAGGPTIDRAEILSAGERVRETLWGTVVSGRADIVTTRNTNISVFIASYDNLGKLLDIKAQVAEVTDSEASVYSPELLVSKDSAKIKLFVFEGLMPLGVAKEIPVVNSRYKMTVSSDDIDSVSVEADYIEFNYWASDDARKPETVTVSSDAYLYVNGLGVNASSADEIVSHIFDYGYPCFYGNITLLNVYDSAQDYDTIVIEDYKTIVVEENNTGSYRIIPKNDEASLSYDPEDENIYAYLFDGQGKRLDWTELKENDVISFKKSVNGITTTIVATKLENSTVTGVVSGIGGSYGNREYVIGGNTYKANPLYISEGDISITDTVTIYLDNFGNIAYAELYVPPMNFAYIIDMGIQGTLDQRTGLKLYTDKGEYKSFNTSSKVKVDGITNISSIDIANGDITLSSAKSAADTVTLVRKQGLDYYVFDTDSYREGSSKITGLTALNIGDAIAYETNDAGEITVIDRPMTVESTMDYEKGMFSVLSTVSGNMEYSSGYLRTDGGRIYLTDDTKIMVVGLDRVGDIVDLAQDDVFMADITTLTNGLVFEDAYAHNVNENREAEFILVTKYVENLGSVTPEKPPVNPPAVSSGAGIGYIIDAKGTEKVIPSVQIKMFTTDGECKAYTLATKVKIDGITIKVEEVFPSDYLAGEDIILDSQISLDDIYETQGEDWFMVDNNMIIGLLGLEEGQLVEYTLNENNEVTKIDRATTNFLLEDSQGKFTEFANGAGDMEYNEAENSFYTENGYILYPTEDTVIIVAPICNKNGTIIKEIKDLRAEDFQVVDSSYLVDGLMLHNCRVYNVDAEQKIGVIFVQTDVEMPTSSMAIVTGYGSVNDENGEPVYAIKAYQDGELKSGETALITKAEDLFGIEEYATFVPKLDLKGKVKDAVVLATVYGDVVDFNSGYMDSMLDYYTKYYYGEVTERNKREFVISGEYAVVSNATNVYAYYSGSVAKDKVTIEDFSCIEFDYDTGEIFFDGDEVSEVYAVAYEYDGEVTDMVLYVIK